MHRPPFFPDPIFGWCFLAVLAALLAVAAVLDLRRMVVPKWLTIGCLAAGVVLTVVRGAWLAEEGESAFVLEPNGIGMGILDGLLFAISGFGVGFAVFFVLWLFGVCGGGDVKLAAALGAWLGWQYLIYVFAVSVGVVAFFLMLKIVGGGVGPGAIRTTLKRRPKLESPGGLVRKSQRRRLTLSMPLAVSTLVVTLWLFRYDLGLAERPMTAAERQRAHELSVYNA